MKFAVPVVCHRDNLPPGIHILIYFVSLLVIGSDLHFKRINLGALLRTEVGKGKEEAFIITQI